MKDNVFEKVVFSFMFVFLIIAMLISLTGFRGPIQFDYTYYNFIQNVNIKLNSFKIEIPNIPTIPTGELTSGFLQVISVIVQFFNFIIRIINILILVLNKVIQLIQFFVILIQELITFSESDFASSGSIEYWE